jgi:hypothetical protein
MNTNIITMITIFAAGLLAASGCERTPAASASRSATPTAPAAMPALPAGLFLTSAPAGTKMVEDAKKDAHAGDPITIRGRIGGSESPFVEDRAMFTLMGPGLPACSDNPDDKCSTPWDYCCENASAIAEHQATIQIVGAGGQPLHLTLKGQNNLRELSDCTIVGTVAQVDGPLLIVNAKNIYVATK